MKTMIARLVDTLSKEQMLITALINVGYYTLTVKCYL